MFQTAALPTESCGNVCPCWYDGQYIRGVLHTQCKYTNVCKFFNTPNKNPHQQAIVQAAATIVTTVKAKRAKPAKPRIAYFITSPKYDNAMWLTRSFSFSKKF